MLNWIWAGMILVSVLCAFFTGKGAAVTDAMLSGAGEGVAFVLKILGTMCLWNGMLHILERSGLSEKISRLLAPLLKRLFPGLPTDSKAFALITLNISADLLGLGNAATPIGLKAMRELKLQSSLQQTASNHMITLVVMNTASITLLPTTVAMLRSEAGAQAPMDILMPVWIVSFLALALALSVTLFCNRSDSLAKRGKQ